MIVLATGFDAMTGALAKIEIVGRGGQMLRDDWKHGPRTYLGLGVDGFPNLFVVSGPGAPAVLANMVLHAEAHVNWIADCISHLDEHGDVAIEAGVDAVDLWIAECAARAEATLFPKADSWYMGANVPGKPRVFMLFVSGFARLQRHLRRNCRGRILRVQPARGSVTSGLSDKVVVVTGAAGGMGRVHCERFADEGAHIIAIDMPAAADELRHTATEVEKRGGSCVTAVADVADLAALIAAVEAGVAELGPLDVIVANAGIYPAGGPTWELTEEVWRRTLDVNLTGVWHTVKAGLRHFADHGGSIILISSTNGLRGTANTAHYTSSKHAVVGLARTLANELGERGIRVNTVHPGAVATAMILNDLTLRQLRPDLEQPTVDDAPATLTARHLLPVPWVEPVDVANAVCVSGFRRSPLHHRHPTRGRCRPAGEGVMSGRLKGKVALVTGAARGIGRAQAVRFAQEGADIIALDICGPVDTVVVPPATKADIAETIRLVGNGWPDRRRRRRRSRFGRREGRHRHRGVGSLGGLDVVCATAGITSRAMTADLSESAWQTMLDVNLTGVWATCRATAPHLIERGGGAMILTSSIAGLRGLVGVAHYTAAKHGVVGLMRSLAELAPHNVRVNTVHPTNVDTPMIQNDHVRGAFRPDLEHVTREQFAEAACSMNMLSIPWVEPIDVANACLFLASDEARYITAVTLPVDAGSTQR